MSNIARLPHAAAAPQRNPAVDQSLAMLFERLEGKMNFTLAWGSGASRRELEGEREEYVATRSKPNGHFTTERFDNLGDAIEWLERP